MMLKRLLAAAALAVSMVLPAAPVAAQEFPRLTLRMAHPLPQAWPAVEWDRWFAEEVARRSGGNIRIEIFWAGQLGGLTEIMNLVRNGAVDMGVFAQAVHASDMPLTSVAAGLLNRVSADARTAQELAGATYATAAVQAELTRLNLHVLKWTVPSPYLLQCNKPVNSTADLRGLRVRAVGGAFVPIWMESYGMVPTRVQATEIREGLTRGTLDCNFGPIEWSPFANLERSAPYLSNINTGAFTTFQLYVPRNRWAQWPESVRTLMTTVAREAMQRELEALPALERRAREQFAQQGGRVVELTDMPQLVERSPDMIAIWAEQYRRQGLGAAVDEMMPLQRRAAESFRR